MKVERKYCEDCKEYRPFQYEPPCSGIESAIWAIAGLFFFPCWFILIWRNLSFGKNWTCQQCGSSNHRDVK